jgi:putative transposase
MVFNCKYQVVFGPQYRRKVHVPLNDSQVKEWILAKQAAHGSTVIEMEGMPAPVDLLLEVDPRIDTDAVVPKRKESTAQAICKEDPWMKSRLPSLWTASSGWKICIFGA